MTRREAAIHITPDFLVELCKARPHGMERRMATLIEHALPVDAKLVRVGVNGNGWIALIIESSEFADVQSGQSCPVLPTPAFRIDYTETK